MYVCVVSVYVYVGLWCSAPVDVCMYVLYCLHTCMYVCFGLCLPFDDMLVCIYDCLSLCMYIPLIVCLFVYMCIGMYVLYV